MQEEIFDFWKFLAGIGVFLWGMNQLESSLKELAGRSFRNILQKWTETPLKGILVGTLITAVLQSSSLVTLMVLAFLGAGVLNLRNAIGVIFGANLGTTLTAWVVATLGFKLSIAAFSMPFLGLGSLVYLFFSDRPMLKNIGAFAVGFGLLFLGLDFMKTAIEDVADQIDLSEFATYGLWIYFVIGIVVTALIQSSSAMVVIILSGVSAGIIGLPEGVALMLGANIGTTITVMIGSLNGAADKKRLALAHFIFNIVTGGIIFLFIPQLIDFTLTVFSIEDPLIEIVLLNTFINLFGILIFYPFINKFESWLKQRFKESEPQGYSTYIKNVSIKVPEAAIAAMEKDIALGLEKTMDFIVKVWDGSEKNGSNMTIWRKIIQQPYDLLSQYQGIKSLEDELTAYHLGIQEENLSQEDAKKMTSLMLCLRTLVYSAKDIKDVMHNIREMEDAEDRLVKDLYVELKTYSFDFLVKLKKYIKTVPDLSVIPNWIGENDKKYQALISNLFIHVGKKKPEIPISSLTNVIKQIISSLDNLGSAVIHWKHLKKEVIDSKIEEQPKETVSSPSIK
ncbi:hypothetical protein P872_24260 [Rhodonellum psychrophilum GCM71 = DSM 17998]|uniref:Sodium:phosphate symporter n=2 Tax=Rhodonellum TaxID=336827 RepID=U5BV60_9BACT|nr:MULTISPECIES: Na/Pi symporter [Rhodonellum]ERM84535.1 hypothetical protein P872_24260 [Rhodonellum psychrophilum GCM71 = DSM 17998]MDO9554809.1 Na/Pi symporter [Rhodonellum sp.]SDY84565.1 phosphate:Na+ symporter [Rhodonellum ikkaensis]